MYLNLYLKTKKYIRLKYFRHQSIKVVFKKLNEKLLENDVQLKDIIETSTAQTITDNQKEKFTKKKKKSIH